MNYLAVLESYRCPKCQGHLNYAIDFECKLCSLVFPVIQGMIDFDLEKSVERLAFDEMYTNQITLSESEVLYARKKALFLINLISKSTYRNINVLEVGAGRGELSTGIYTSGQICESRFFFFDHSMQSMRILQNSLETQSTQQGNSATFALMDVFKMAYKDNFFDLIFGNAVLHHFLDFEFVIKKCCSLLKPGGRMIFTEPFLSGYSLLSQIWVRVYSELFGKTRERNPEFLLQGDLGYLEFIIENIRIRSNRDLDVLANMTDKHLFLESDFQAIADDIGVCVSFYEYQESPEASRFMINMLDTYLISNANFRNRAIEYWQEYVDSVGSSLHGLHSPFKAIVFKK